MKLLTLTVPGVNSSPLQIHGVGGMPEGGPDSLLQIVRTGLDLLLLGAVILSLFFLIWGGFNWLMSEGDKQRVASARQKIVYSILGLLVVFFAFLIINVIHGFLLGSNAGPLNYNNP